MSRRKKLTKNKFPSETSDPLTYKDIVKISNYLKKHCAAKCNKDAIWVVNQDALKYWYPEYKKLTRNN